MGDWVSDDRGIDMQKKLSRKITAIVLVILLLIISFMVFSVYSFSKSFYKNHLAEEVEHRITSHTAVMEAKFDIVTITHVLKMEKTEAVHLILFDRSFSPIVTSDRIPDELVGRYQEWVRGISNLGSGYNSFPVTHYIETGAGFHIPHVWSMHPIVIEGEVEGYLFIDQDTGEFQQTKVELLKLLLTMGLVSFVTGLLLTIYLTKKISKPLHAMGNITHKIAKGEFDANLDVEGDDEVGQLAKDIRLMAKQLKEYRDSRQQFLSNVSHDLRTPLTYIKGYSALMKDSSQIDENQWRRNVDVIYQEANRMEHLVRDLFQLTKLDVGQIKLRVESVQIVPWLRSIIESRQLMFDHYSLTCKLHYTMEDVSAGIDRERMTQVINNLLENCIRYTKKGGVITLSVSEEKEQVKIEIRDTGIGIPEENLPRIWERFYRVDKSRSTIRGGSGLGLAIVKELVQLHGGEIEVKSTAEKGTIFTIYLKREK